MKKKILAILLVACLIGVSTLAFGFTSAGAQTLDEADRCFRAYMSAELNDSLTYTRTPLYDEELAQSGWQYDFVVGDKSGYALLARVTVGNTAVYEVQEARFDGVSPFDACVGLPVYITHKKYLDCRGETFYDLATGEIVSAAQIAEYAYYGFRYTGGSNYYNVNETINYASKATTEEYKIQYELPTYSGVVGASNCANVAGSIAVGYYDRFSSELIPNYQTYELFAGVFFQYKTMNANIGEVQKRLYTLMDTDIGGAGTTFTGFQQGMGAFARERGYTYQSEDMFSIGNLNFYKLKTAVKAGKPVALFLSKFAFSTVSTAGSTDTVKNVCSDVPHVVMCCGYRVDQYYDASGAVLSTRIYLRVASGLLGTVSGMLDLNINGLSALEQAVSTYIG